jgi:hypothetical protein
MSPETQSLLREQPTVDADVDVVHAGATSTEANATPISQAAIPPLLDLSGLCVSRFIDSPSVKYAARAVYTRTGPRPPYSRPWLEATVVDA